MRTSGRTFRTGFTTRAACLIAAGVTAIGCGVALGERDLVRAGIFALLLPLIAAASVHGSRVSISSQRAMTPGRAAPAEPITTQIWITNRSVLPTGPLMLEDTLGAGLAGRARFVLGGMTPRQVRTVNYQLTALGRGRYTTGPLRLHLADPFGLVSLTRSFTATSQVVVTPQVDPITGLSLPMAWDSGPDMGSHSIGVHGADDASTREYRRGDDLRKIHWRTTARTGVIMVRHEEQPLQGQTALLLDTRGVAHETTPTDHLPRDQRWISSLEWAISCTASVGAELLRAGRTTTLFTPSTESNRDGDSGQGPLPSNDALLDRLADLRPAVTNYLTDVVDLVMHLGRDATLVAVLGRQDPRSIAALCRVGGRRGGVSAFAVLLDVDTWHGGADLRWNECAARLESAGWRVVRAGRGDTTADAVSAMVSGRHSHSGSHPDRWADVR